MVTWGPPREVRPRRTGRMVEDWRGGLWIRCVQKRLMNSLGPDIYILACASVISLGVGLQPSGASQVKLRIGPWNMRSRERWEKRGHTHQIGGWQF